MKTQYNPKVFDLMKVVTRENFIVLTACIKKRERERDPK